MIKIDDKDFIKFIESKPKNEKYNYWCNHCLIGQYFKSKGATNVVVGSLFITFIKNNKFERLNLPKEWDRVSNGGTALDSEYWTFGKALGRARKWLKIES